MRKILIIFFGVFLALHFSSSNGATSAPDSRGFSAIYQQTLNELNLTILDEKLSNNEKLKQLEVNLDTTKKYVSGYEYSLLFKKAESTLLLDADDINATTWQLIFLCGQYNNPDIWVFSESRDVMTTKIIELKNRSVKKNAENSNSSSSQLDTLNGIVNLLTATELSYQGKYEEADKFFEQVFEESKSSGALYPQVKFIISGNKLKSLLARGDMANAIKLSQILDDDFDATVNMLSNLDGYYSSLGPVGISMLSSMLELDRFLGKNEVVIKKATLLLSKISDDKKYENEVKVARSALMKILVDTYEITGNKEMSDFYNKEVAKLAASPDYVDFEILFHDFYTAMSDSRFERANDVVNKMFNYYNNLYPFSDSGEKLGMSRMIDELRKYIADAEYASKNFSECVSEGCIKYRSELTEYQMGLKNGLYRYPSPELESLFKSMITLYEDSDKAEKKAKEFWLHGERFAPILEDMYYKGLVAGILGVPSQLQYLSALYDYYSMNNKPYAAYFAKQYINKFQSLRSKINVVNTKDLISFTDSQQDKLKKFSITFFEVGDNQSALMVLKIIKENEFFDFVRRKDVGENFLSELKYPKVENDLNLRIENLLVEIKAIKSAELNKNKNETLLIKNAILKKEQELDSVRRKLKIALLQTVAKATSELKQQSGIKLNSGEAMLQIFLMPNSVESYLTTDDKTEHFVFKIEREKITAKILELNLLLSKKLPIPADKLSYLSEYIIPDLSNILKSGKVTKLRILSDSYLTLIPLNILKVNDVELGELFVTETVALGQKYKIINQNLKPTFDAFGASEGNSEFKSLPGVRTEIETLMTIPMTSSIKNRNSYLDRDFNRKQFVKSFTQGSSIIHIASHFRSQGNLAGSSQLLLGDGSTISLEDIRSDLPKLSTNLITLSACDTGDLIPSSKGQVFEGLSNTFQVNGAKNVISTLWSISDEVTAKFMGIFYTLLLNNEISPSEALFYTQNIFRHGSTDVLPKNIIFKHSENESLLSNLNRYSHPYYWAAFRISSLN